MSFPPSSDMVEFYVAGGRIRLHCLICDAWLPQDVLYLNEAIVAWRDHRADVS